MQAPPSALIRLTEDGLLNPGVDSYDTEGGAGMSIDDTLPAASFGVVPSFCRQHLDFASSKTVVASTTTTRDTLFLTGRSHSCSLREAEEHHQPGHLVQKLQQDENLLHRPPRPLCSASLETTCYEVALHPCEEAGVQYSPGSPVPACGLPLGDPRIVGDSHLKVLPQRVAPSTVAAVWKASLHRANSASICHPCVSA